MAILTSSFLLNCSIHLSPTFALPSPFRRYIPPITSVIRLSSFVIPSLFRHIPPSAYGLRPNASSLFFRLETLFLPFFVSLYYTMSQLLIYPFYTNRPRFV